MALGKKVKTLYLGSTQAISPADNVWVNAVASHTFQDDIRIIGVQVAVIPKVHDAAMNADHELVMGAEVSRHGLAAQDGAIAESWWATCYTAAVVSPAPGGGPQTVMFPDGHGIDLDDGEVIYLHAFKKGVGTVAVDFLVWTIVYYVER